MKVLIVDDERPARERLQNLISAFSGYEICAAAANGVEALQLTQRLSPDIVLMDIRMPGMDGLEAARHLSMLDAPPAVIFISAYDDRALEAFETQAMDYLVKPVHRKRLEQALLNTHRLNRAQLSRLDIASNKTLSRSHICARLGNNLELVSIENVLYFQADQKYVSVRHLAGEIIIEESLKSLSEEFELLFLRIHRNALVAKAHIAGLEKTNDNQYYIVFKNSDERLLISRRHLASVRQSLKTQ